MRELGENSADAHQKIIADAISKCPDAQLITVGEEMRLAVTTLGLRGVLTMDDVEEVRDPMQSLATPGTWILLKGSHSLNLASLCPAK